MWKKKLYTLFFAFCLPFIFTQGVNANGAPPIQVIWNDIPLLEMKAIVKDGRVFLPLRKTTDLLQGVTVWNNKTNTIKIQRPETTIILNIGSKSAKVNGRDVLFDSPPFIMKGVTYVPLRFTVTAFGIDVSWNAKESLVSVITEEQLASASSNGNYFWLDNHTGSVYALFDNKSISKLGDTTFKIEGISPLYSSITHIEPNTYLFNIKRSGGTTIALQDHYQILIHDSKIVKTSKVRYFDGIVGKNQVVHNGEVIMRDGSNVIFVNPDGSINKSFDLAKLTNLNENTFNVEAVFDDYLLVKARPYGTLLLIDRNTNESVALYKTLLTKDQQHRVDTWDKTDLSFQGDGLSFIERDGQNLTLTFTEWWSSSEVSTLQFKISD